MKTVLPVLVVVAVLVVVWYVAAIFLNAPFQLDSYSRNNVTNWGWTKFLADVWSQDRPSLPAPHQVLAEFWKSTATVDPFNCGAALFIMRG